MSLHLSQEGVAFVFKVHCHAAATSSTVAIASTSNTDTTVCRNRAVSTKFLGLNPDRSTCTSSSLTGCLPVTTVGLQLTVNLHELKKSKSVQTVAL